MKTADSSPEKKRKQTFSLPLFLGLCLLLVTYVVTLFHLSTFPPPKQANLKLTEKAEHAFFIPKAGFGINQLVVHGTPYERGLASGILTKEYLKKQEDILSKEFLHFFPNPVGRYVFMLAAMRWFWGVDRYVDEWVREELYGLSKSASTDMDYLIDRYTRKFVYHGIHEVGQFFVDQQSEDLGCSLFAVPHQQSWILGRNFDFEVGRFFDDEKVMRWAFPDKGNAYVSVSWSGMLGAITGVNEKQVYISFNAAGSQDLRRYGTPSTLVVTKALLTANTGEEAVKIIEDATVFISDIYVVADGKSGKLYKIEKTPKRHYTVEITKPTMIANHFIEKDLLLDPVNQYRMNELTSIFRQMRGDALLKDLGNPELLSTEEVELEVLSFLRDKFDENGNPVHLGSRRAIDALIASHSVVYNAKNSVLYVSQGPALAGEYIGFNLAESFRLKTPIWAKNLPRDPEVTNDDFYSLKDALKLSSEAEKLISQRKCDEAKVLLDKAHAEFADHINFDIALGKYYECEDRPNEARKMWERALAKRPAFAKQVEFLQGKVL